MITALQANFVNKDGLPGGPEQPNRTRTDSKVSCFSAVRKTEFGQASERWPIEIEKTNSMVDVLSFFRTFLPMKRTTSLI